MRISFVCALFICLLTVFPASAQEAASGISQDRINELVETLESETARKEFIENLKTLSDAHEEQKEEDLFIAAQPISETLGIEEQTQSFINKYSAFLENNNLNGSTVGKAALTTGSFIVFLVLAYAVRKLTYVALRRLLDLKEKYSLTHSRFKTYARILRLSGYSVLALLFVYSMSMIWGISDIGIFESDAAVTILGNIVNIVFVILVTAVIWEMLNGFIEYSLRRSGLRDSSRTRTLLPIVRNVLFIVFACFFGLMLMSELGIDIMPLLAGAGVLGIAVGFGAQSMVKDFISGFTVILEDLMQVGDRVTLAGRNGWVEKITIRKVQMRDLDGTVYTIPFSEIEIVENHTKDYSYYLMDVGIAYREDPDEVVEYLKEIDAEMRDEDSFGNSILEPIEILGVDNFADSAVIIKARMKTKPKEQWKVGREFNRRMKHKFDKHNVEIPFPHQTIYFGENKDGSAPAAPVVMKDKDKENLEDAA